MFLICLTQNYSLLSMRYVILIIFLISCSTNRYYLTEQQVLTDTINSNLHTTPNLKADRTDSINGYWRKTRQGKDSVYIKPYVRRPRKLE